MRLDHRGAIGGKNGHPLPGLDPGAAKGVGQAIDPLAKLRIVIATSSVDYRDAVAKYAGTAP